MTAQSTINRYTELLLWKLNKRFPLSQKVVCFSIISDFCKFKRIFCCSILLPCWSVEELFSWLMHVVWGALMEWGGWRGVGDCWGLTGNNYCGTGAERVLGPQWSYYRMPKFKSPQCNTSATSKGQWWNLIFVTQRHKQAIKAKWWNFELLTESLVWYPGKIIGLLRLI